VVLLLIVKTIWIIKTIMEGFRMKKDKQFLSFIDNINKEFTGWDFAYITRTGRIDNEMLSWSYGSKSLYLMQNAKSTLDMGTGGGEFLSMLQKVINLTSL
jgi:hypothetical protein